MQPLNPKTQVDIAQAAGILPADQTKEFEMHLALPIYAAGAMSAITFLAHVFVGTTKNAGPILHDERLPNGPRATLTFSWEANSILLVFMTLGFLGAAYWDAWPLLVFNTVLAATLSLWAGVVTIRKSISVLRFPPAPMFLVIAVLGGIGISG
jgi:hypothetical protein